MKTLKQFLEESMNSPYSFKKIDTVGSNPENQTHYYGFEDNKGKRTSVVLRHKGSEAHADFTDESGEFSKTGHAGTNSIRHFSTVKKIIQQHAKDNPHIKSISFTSDKTEGSGRHKLYKRLTKMAGGQSEDHKDYGKHTIPVNKT